MVDRDRSYQDQDRKRRDMLIFLASLVVAVAGSCLVDGGNTAPVKATMDFVTEAKPTPSPLKLAQTADVFQAPVKK
jgi:hypothetical protein